MDYIRYSWSDTVPPPMAYVVLEMSFITKWMSLRAWKDKILAYEEVSSGKA